VKKTIRKPTSKNEYMLKWIWQKILDPRTV